MKSVNNLLIVIILFLISGCEIGPSTHEIFLENFNYEKGQSYLPKINIKRREIYDENRYIYKLEYPTGCHFAFLTNRDDKPEVVQEIIILSGKEYCKMRKKYTF
ncbi:hypothetical protein CMUC_1930 [Campylobacter mucosalis CCUG 21559]|uniref:Lipoprotein n=1 Tax=Campylobacter mucosalis CCUG 21559 TaxID=1032067 RepID=A0A6G5QJ41_9BACT|nr:hypothetical protein CMUC_1930 [Campylobacter mucosalis CCUG 21559]